VPVKIFCQVHNDPDIVEDWIRWHSYLFGFSNLYVIADRPSPGTRLVLEKYSNLINVLEAPLGSWPDGLGWDQVKAENINKAISLYSGESDFVIPIDIDEFIFYGKEASKNKIHAELARLKKSLSNLFKFHSEYFSHTLEAKHERPACEITRFTYHKPSYDMLKCFAKSSKFSRVGLGQHNIYSKDKSDFAISTGLLLLHFKWRGRQHMIDKVLENATLSLSQSDGTTRKLRGGHDYKGKQFYESGDIYKWIAVNVGSSSDTITGLSEFLS